MHRIEFTPLVYLRERLRSTLREFLFFLLLGAAITVIVWHHAIEAYVLEGEIGAAIAFSFIFGCFIGLPLWALVRLLRFAAGR